MSLGRDREQGHPHHLNQDLGQQQEQDHHQQTQEGGGLPDQDPGHWDHQEGGEPPPASWRAGGSQAPGGCLCPTPGLGQAEREGEEGAIIINVDNSEKHIWYNYVKCKQSSKYLINVFQQKC